MKAESVPLADIAAKAGVGESVLESAQRQATPVWSMELLLSGGLVFAMFECLRWTDGLAMRLMNHLSGVDVSMAAMLYMYVVGAFGAIFATFALHLMLRTVWVGLIGVMSVFPAGIRWDQSIGSKKSTELARAMLANPTEIIESLDNRCTLVFAGGILISSFLVGSVVIVTVFGLIAWTLQTFLLPTMNMFNLLAISFGLFFTPYFLLVMFDAIVSAAKPDAAILNHTSRILMSVSAAFVAKPNALLTSMITTNLGRNRGFLFLMIVPVLAGIFSVTRVAADRAGFGPLDAKRALESFSAETINAQTYADTREANSTEPFIEGMQSTSDYVKLRIPYHFKNMDGIVNETCPALDKSNYKATQVCLANALNIKLNGKPIDASLQILRDEERIDLLQMIDVRKLSEGEHALSVKLIGRKREDDKMINIKFWR